MVSVHQVQGVENSVLLALIRTQQGTCLSRRKGKSDGWTGPATLFLYEEARALQQFIRPCLPSGSWELRGWANVLQSGDSIPWHEHTYTGNRYAGVYYPCSAQGPLEFETGERFEPIESQLILFPASLKHRVSADSERISIAFNVRTLPV